MRTLVGLCDKCGHVLSFHNFPVGEPIPDAVDCPNCVGLGQMTFTVKESV